MPRRKRSSYQRTFRKSPRFVETLEARRLLAAVNDTGATAEDMVLMTVNPGATASLLANDTTPGATVVAFQSVSAQGASVSVNANGTFSYDPTGAPAIRALDNGENVVDTFTYSIAVVPAPVTNTNTGVPGTILGTGTGALLNGDLTDPENDGDPEADVNYNAIFSGFDGGGEAPTFGGAEGAFNIFDNLAGGGNNKWCCNTPGPASPDGVGLFVAAQFSQSYVLTHFTLTSSNDSPDRDPRVWALEGSNDGISWAPIYSDTNQAASPFSARDQVVLFKSSDSPIAGGSHFESNVAYTHFRYFVDSANIAAHALGELELFGVPRAVETATVNITVTGESFGQDDAAATNENTVLAVPAPGVLLNDDPGFMVVSNTNSVQGAAVTVNADGSGTYDPTGAANLQALAEGAVLNDTFTYTIADATTAPVARFVQIIESTNDGDERFHLSELEAFAAGVTPDNAGGATFGGLSTSTNDIANGSAVAYGLGNTTTVGTWTDTGFDQLEHGNGNTNPNNILENGGNVWSTRNDAAAERPQYTLDLGGEFAIDRIRAWPRADTCCTDRWDNLTINLYADDGTGNPGDLVSTTSIADPGGNVPHDILIAPVGSGNIDLVTVTVTVTGINDAPIAVADTNAVTEAAGAVGPTTATGNVLSNDTDVDHPNAALTVTTTGAIVGTYGTLQLNANGTYTYTLDDANPAVGALQVSQTLTDTLNYTMTDSGPNAMTASSTLTITISGVNDPPTAVNDAAAVTEDVTTTASGNLLTGTGADTDADHPQASLNVTAVNGSTNPATDVAGLYGTLDWNADGSYTYSLDPAAANPLTATDTVTDSFTYSVADPFLSGDGLFEIFAFQETGGGSDTQLDTTTETLGIWLAIEAGATVPGTVAANGNTYGIGAFEGDLENRVYYGGDFDGFTGSLAYDSINANGPGGGGGSITGGDDFSVIARAVLAFNVGGTYSISAGSDDGRLIQLAPAAPGSAPGYSGFTATGDQQTATGDPNLIMFDGTTGHQHTTGVFTVAAGDILMLDTFFFERGGGDQFHLSIKSGSDTTHGGAPDGWQLLRDGALGIGVASTNSFTRQSSSTATLNVTITGSNDAPTANNDTATVTESGTVTIPGAALTANDTDPDTGAPAPTVQVDTAFDDATGFNLVGTAAVTGGRLQLTTNAGSQQGSAWTTNRVDLEDGFIAEFEFGFPGDLGGGADGMTFSVQNIGNAVSVGEGSAGAGALTISFDSFDNGPGDPSGSFVRVFADGAIVAEQNLSFDLSGSTANVARIQLAGGALSVVVNGEIVIGNVAVNLAALGAVDGTGAGFVGFGARTGGSSEEHNIDRFTITSLQNTNADVLSVQSVMSAGGAIVTLNGDGSVTYDPNGQFDGLAAGDTIIDTFTYTVTDGNGGTDSATVSVTITGENSPPVAVDDTAIVNEDGPPVNIDPVTNDTDPDTGATNSFAPIDLPQFDTAAGFNLVGTASVSGGKLRLTSNANNQTGSAWTTNRVEVANGFTAEFEIGFPNILLPDGRGADGASFSVQNIANNLAIGEGSAGATALTISFDSFDNGAADPSGSFIRVFAGGVNVAEQNLAFDLSGTDNIQALIEYAPGDLTITINGMAIISNLNVDLGALGAVNADGEAFVGFGARTGGAAEEHNINSFTLTAVQVTEPDSLLVDGHRFHDFSSASGLQLNGDAMINGTVLELAQNENNQQGSAFLDTRQYVLDGFATSFTFDLAQPGGAGADGMFFAVHNDAAGAGFVGTQSGPNGNSLTIEIDSHDNGAGAGDPSAANIKIRTNTSVGGIIATYNLNMAPFNIADLSGTGEHTIEVVYDGGFLDVTFDGVLIFDNIALDITSLGAVDANGEAFVGFGGRTGGLNEISRVLEWDFHSTTTETLPSGAIITRNADGTIDYDPNGQFESLAVGATATDTFTYTVSDGNGGMSTGNVVVTIEGANDPVTNVNAGGPYTVAEGGSVSLSATFDDVDLNDTYTISWDVNGDGTFGDTTGQNPTLTWAQLQALGINDGPSTFNVSVQVDDGGGPVTSAAATTLTVTNVAPTAAITGPSFGVLGIGIDFTFTATDVANADQAANFTFDVDWGDGTVEALSGTSPLVASHGFQNFGLQTITLTATDKDGGVSAVVTHEIDIVPIAVVGDDLQATGTPSGDVIIFYPSNSGVRVRYNNVVYPTDGSSYSFSGQIVANGEGGSDRIIVAGGLTQEVVFDGGIGNDYLAGGTLNDTLSGGAGNDIVLAGEGNNYLDGGDDADRLEGRSGSDVIFGGAGTDRLNGGAGDDILDAGAGNDFVFADVGNDLLLGGSGFDTANGSWGNDIVLGGDDSDQIFGGSDNDLLLGGAGIDRLRGDAGNDSVLGGNSSSEAAVQAALDAMLASLGTDLATADAAVRSALDAWFTTGTDRSGFGSLIDDGLVDDLTGGTGTDEFSSGDRARDLRLTDGDVLLP